MTNDKKNARSFEELTLEKLTRIETVLLGVPNTKDNGLVGEVYDIAKICRKQDEMLGVHTEAIATIVTRCDERTGCGPLSKAEVKQLRGDRRDLARSVKIGAIVTGITGGLSGLIYGLIELFKHT